MGNFVVGSRESVAPPEAVWAVLADADAWPRAFAPHLRAAHLDGPLGVGISGWVETRIPPGRSAFTVTAVTEGVAWSWRGRILWLTMDYDHCIDRNPGGSRVTLDASPVGPLAGIVRAIGRPIYRRQMKRALDQLVRSAASRGSAG